MRYYFFGEALNRFEHFGLLDPEVDVHDEAIHTGLGVGGQLVDHFRRGANG